jgi:hypothetical protein
MLLEMALTGGVDQTLLSQKTCILVVSTLSLHVAHIIVSLLDGVHLIL